jgi:hypothetical protein
MAKELWIMRYVFESLSGKLKWFEKSGLEKISTDKPLCFTKAWIESWKDSCELDHINVNSAIAILLNKCENKYS